MYYFILGVCHCVAFSSCVSNPVLYGWLNTNLRKEFLKVKMMMMMMMMCKMDKSAKVVSLLQKCKVCVFCQVARIYWLHSNSKLAKYSLTGTQSKVELSKCIQRTRWKMQTSKKCVC